jgi:hypothetical protein
MPEKAFTFGAAYGRERGEGVGLAPRTAIDEQVTPAITAVGAPDTFGELFFLPGDFCVEPLDVWMRIDTAAAGSFEYRAALGDTQWWTTNLTTGLDAIFANGGLPVIELAPSLVLGGPPVPLTAIRINGAALTNLGIGPHTATVVVRSREFNAAFQISHERGVTFHDSPIDIENIPAVLAQLELIFGSIGAGPAVLGTDASVPDTRKTVPEASLAFPHPCNLVWLGPADIGNQPEQIPADLASNSALHYRYHPSSFFREPQYVRVIQSEPTAPWRKMRGDEPSAAPVTAPQGALTILRVIRAPTHSRWILTIDSVELDVLLAHPVGSDLRRPEAIYKSVIVPAVWANNATGSPLATWQRDPANPNVFRQIGVENKLQFLEHALFVEPLDGSPLAITEVFYQTGAVNPPPPPPP